MDQYPRVLEADLSAVISRVLINCPLTLSWQTPRREGIELWRLQPQILPKLRLQVPAGPAPSTAALQICITSNRIAARNLSSVPCFLLPNSTQVRVISENTLTRISSSSSAMALNLPNTETCNTDPHVVTVMNRSVNI